MPQVHPIVVGIDGSETARTAVDWAAARARRIGSELLLVHTVPDFWLTSTDTLFPTVAKTFTRLLGDERNRISTAVPRDSIHTLVRMGEPAVVLGELSAEASLMVVGTDKHPGMHGQGFGAVGLQIATTSLCTVAVIPRRPTTAGGGVVVGVDGAAEARRALLVAAAEAHSLGRALTIVYASPVPNPWLRGHLPEETLRQKAEDDQRLVLWEAAAAVAARYPDVLVHRLYEPRLRAGEALVRAAKDADLLVVGSRGRNAVRHAMVGSVVPDILAHAPCPTLITTGATGKV